LKLLLIFLTLTCFLYSSENNPTEQELAKLYVATFNRAPDSAGLDYWVASGLKLSQIAQSFFDQEETQELYPTGTINRDFIKSVYLNLFNRIPDDAGWDYWENELDTGSFSKNSFIQALINGALDTDVSKDASILTNKGSVGLSFAKAGLNDVTDAKTIMTGVNDDINTLNSALNDFFITLFVPIPIEDTIIEYALNVDNLTIQVHENTFYTTSKMYTELNKTLVAFDKMNESIIDTMDNNMKLVNTLARVFKISDSYSSIFAITSDYTATKPAFIIKQTLTKKYFLVSSESRFFVDSKTIKTYFFDSASLTNAWTRAISTSNKTKNLYLSLLEIDNNGNITKVTNSFLIKSVNLQTL